MKTFDHIQSGRNFNAGRKLWMALSHIFQSYIYQGNISKQLYHILTEPDIDQILNRTELNTKGQVSTASTHIYWVL